MGRYEEAIIIIDGITTPIPTKALNNKALALVRLGWIDEALKIYDEAIKNEPENAILWIKKGFALEKIDRYDEAAICYNKAAEVNKE